MKNDPRGSYWRRWDLHVHTPASYVQNYGSDEVAWERFLCDLEALPSEFAVIGINDYLFIDGYRRVLKEKAAGRIANIKTIFPVIELRLSKLAGTDKLSRINYHIIFSDELAPEMVETQFLNQLRTKAVLSPEAQFAGVSWRGYIDKASVESLGVAVRSQVPERERAKFTETDFELGMNNLNFNEDDLLEILESGGWTSQNYITAIGKTEWDNYRWNDHSIAEKKTIINSVDIVFTAADSVAAFQRAREKLVSEGVNSTLFDCSDAHHFADSDHKDRIGNCFLWIKADPTFDGLKIALQDYDDRVFVGNEPPVFERLRGHPRGFIRSVTFNRKTLSGSKETWFGGQHLELNPELVAIIGNRGNGKSALLDCIAFAAQSDHPVSNTSFLEKFRKSKDGKAGDFTVEIGWEGGASTRTNLADEGKSGIPAMVKHLPQHFIDQLCNEGSARFTEELEGSIYSHVPEHELLDSTSLRELVKKRSHKHEAIIAKLRGELGKTNVSIVDLEKQQHPQHKDTIQSRIASMKEEIGGLFQNRLPLPPRPVANVSEEEKVMELRRQHEEMQEKIAKLESRRKEVRISIEAVNRLQTNISRVKDYVDEVMEECQEDMERLDIDFADIVEVKIDASILAQKNVQLNNEKAGLDAILDDQDSEIRREFREIASQLAVYTREMTQAQQRYQEAVASRTGLRQQIQELIGDTEKEGSIRNLEMKLSYIQDSLVSELDTLCQKRLEIARELLEEYRGILSIYKELYGPVQTFVDTYSGSAARLDVAFEATLKDVDFSTRFFDFVSQNRRGTFYGTESGQQALSELLSKVDFNAWSSVEDFLLQLISCLVSDQRSGCKGESRYVHEQLKRENTEAFYDFIFGLDYLHPRYQITMNGKTLAELSSGEKGALLLVFYLLVDKSDVPLLIDQPEENLDNQSVYAVLRPFIREARLRRQVILVTHNPNIAVAAGADQVIYTSIDKTDGNAVSYETGSLENPVIRQRIVDVLEGTMPAFHDRRQKYALRGSV